MTEPLVEIEKLERYFYENDSLFDRLLGRDPVAVKAVDGVTLDIASGETLGLVGESGCGKSTTGETVLRLQEPTGGTVRFDGQDIYELSGTQLAEFRRRAQIVFQDPFSSLDPRMTVADIVRQPLEIHDWPWDASADSDDRLPAERRRDRVRELIERVGLSTDQLERYPGEFSGGQRQRIAIARALALDPDFLVLDEPTSALDVSVQAQILNLLDELQTELGLTYLLISHDLSVIRHICDRVAVMYLGEIVEVGPAGAVFTAPKHPYTESLLESVPRANSAERTREITPLSGDVPSPRNPPSGCRFRTRCPKVIPPEDVDLDQHQYRDVMDLRQQIEAEAISEETIQAMSDDEASDVDVLAEQLLSVDLPADHLTYVREALRAVADDRYGAAADKLETRYGSVCERDNPGLAGRAHPVACHLYE